MTNPIFPIDENTTYNMVSTYGVRIHPIYGVQKFHDGVDIFADPGTAVMSMDGGTIVANQTANGYGNVIVVENGDGTGGYLYAHMQNNSSSSPALSEGSTVTKGFMIGAVGHTGIGTGDHLHVEKLTQGAIDSIKSAKTPTTLGIDRGDVGPTTESPYREDITSILKQSQQSRIDVTIKNYTCREK